MGFIYPSSFKSKITIIGIKLVTTYTESTFLKYTFGKKKKYIFSRKKNAF